MGITFLIILGIASPGLARSKKRSAIHQGLVELDQALNVGDIESARSIANHIYEDLTGAAVPTASAGVIIDPAMKTDTTDYLRRKAACEIAERFYKRAELELAREWAERANTGGSMANEFVRRARICLGDIAVAMDRDNDAIEWFTSVLNEKNQYREQPVAYAHLLDLFLMKKQENLAEDWVRHGQGKLEGAGGLEIEFLREVSVVLKKRNHPLWSEINEQIVELDPKKGKLQALRELASNARKFGRWAEAEQRYADICALDLRSPEECVNAHLFLAAAKAAQNKDVAPAIQALQDKANSFPGLQDREYASYRIGKFYHSEGLSGLAEPYYSSLVNSNSSGRWVAGALYQLGAIKEQQGELETALQLYMQCPQRFPQNDRLVLQSLARAIGLAAMLGDEDAVTQIEQRFESRFQSPTGDYETDLNLALFYKKRGRQPLAERFLETGLQRASGALAGATDVAERIKVHFHVTRRFTDFRRWQEILDYVAAHDQDFAAPGQTRKLEYYGCSAWKFLALQGLGRHSDAQQLCNTVLSQIRGDPKLEANFVDMLATATWFQSGFGDARELFEWLDSKWPTHPMTQSARIQLAADRFNAVQFSDALALANKAIAACPETSKMTGIQQIFWEATYVRGRCLIALGNVEEGDALVRRALNSGKAALMKLRLNSHN